MSNNNNNNYNIRAVVLAGYNRGKALVREEKEKRKMELKGFNTFARGYKVLQKIPCTDKTVLEYTLDGLLSSEYIDSDNVFVVGGKNELKSEIPNLSAKVVEMKDSLQENTYYGVKKLYSGGYRGDSIIICGDVPAIRGEDINDFIIKARETDADMVAGVGILDEYYSLVRSHQDLKSVGKISKGAIKVYDDMNLSGFKFPKIHYGNIYYVRRALYDKLDEVRKNMEPVFELKKLFNNPDNFTELEKILKDDSILDSKIPNNDFSRIERLSPNFANLVRIGSMIYFGLRYSSIIHKLTISNLVGRIIPIRNPDYYFSLSEFTDVFNDKILKGCIKASVAKVSPRMISDFDDMVDLERNALIIKNQY